MLTESLVLAGLGGVAGILLARWSLAFLVANIPMTLPENAPATLNLRVLAFSVTLSAVSGIVFGLAPAWRLSRANVGAPLLHGSGAGGTLSRRNRSWLIVAEVAVAIVLSTGAALMIRSFSRMMAIDLGFDPGTIVTLDAETVDPSPSTVSQYYPVLLDRLRVLPGISAAGAIDDLPLGHRNDVTIATAEGVELGVAERKILPGYFQAIGLPLEAGRLPDETDRHGSLAVVIDDAAAKRLFADGSPIGRIVTLRGHPQPRRVIGVVGNVRYFGPLVAPYPEVYEVLGPPDDAGTTPRVLTVVVRSSMGERGLAAELRHAAASVGPRVLVGDVKTGDDWLQNTVITPRRRTVLLGLLGAFGLLLTLVGIFGVTAYAVARRTREIGVRIALGAQPRDVSMTMLTDVARPVAIGIVIGLTAAMFATRILESFLFETTPTDPSTFATVAVAIAIAALFAGWVPSRRALRVDPVRALRME